MQDIKFTSHKQYLIGLLFSIKVKKEDSYRPKCTSSFLICPNLNDSQTVKNSSCKIFFSSLYAIDATCFNECFLFHVITGRRYFFQKFVVTVRFFQRHIVVFFGTSVLKKVRILRYLHNNSAVLILMLMLSSKNKAIEYFTYTDSKNFRS